MKLLAVALSIVAGAVMTMSAGGASTSYAFELVFDGHHGSFPNGTPRHEGPFTASSPFCTSGSIVDLVHEGAASATRLNTCADGGGTITMRIFNYPDEHIPGGHGTWTIIEGTGNYSTLRGKGTWSSVPGVDTAFRNTLRGVVDFDAEPPVITISRASAAKLRRPARAYLFKTSFTARDNVQGNVVSYRVTVTDGSPASFGGVVLADRKGQISSGSVTLALRIRVPKGTARIRLEISASDPLGQERSRARVLKLRR